MDNGHLLIRYAAIAGVVLLGLGILAGLFIAWVL